MTDETDLVPWDGPEHREEMERRLEETEFDTELGMELAVDAQRVVAGEMSEDEFHEKYHDDIEEEFGEDERELDLTIGEESEGGITDRVSGAFEDGQSRREFVKKGGVAAMGLSMLMGGNDQASSGGEEKSGDGKRLGMVINLNNCDGCLECVAACKGLHGTSKGAHWIYVMTYADPQHEQENFFVRTCMHCADAPCEKVCPIGARHTREKDGLVLTDYNICIGCRYCMVSCPYGANYFQWGDPDEEVTDHDFILDERGKWVDGPPPNGAMGKCTFEPAWQDGRQGENLVGTTMCEQACTRDAIHFGDLNDPESDPNKHIEEYRAAHQNDRSEFENRNPNTVSTFRAMEDRGTDPGVIFIGNEPSVEAEQVDGPVDYKDFGLVDNRKKEVLDKGGKANQEGQ